MHFWNMSESEYMFLKWTVILIIMCNVMGFLYGMRKWKKKDKDV